MAKKSDIYERIGKALPAHYSQLNPHRELRRAILAELRGTLHPSQPVDGFWKYPQYKQILPLMRQASDSLVMGLAAHQPQFLVTPKDPKYKAFGAKLERALNRYASTMYLAEILQEIVRDAFVGLGISKLFMADSISIGYECDYRADPGVPFLQRVCLNDFVWDVTAPTFAQSSFFADRYKVSHEKLMNDNRFRKWHKELENVVGQLDPEEERPAHLQGIEDFVWLADVYVPYNRMIYTFLVDERFALNIKEPIARMKWTGTDAGPYGLLGFGDTPDEIFPTSPAQTTKLLSELANTCVRKLEDQARRQKTLFVGPPGNEKDTEAFRDASDGEYISASGGGDSIKQVRLDGPDAQLFGFFLNMLDQHSQAAGNLKHKLGLGPSADTLGQESMIGSNVSRIEGFLQQRYAAFVRTIGRGLARLMWEDGFLKVPGFDTVPGTNFSVPDEWVGSIEPGSRQGQFSDYMVDIAPYSMTYRSPGERMAFIQQQFERMLPALPMLAEYGIRPDFGKYIETLAKLSNTPEIKEIFKTEQQPQVLQSAGGSAQVGGAKEYRHRSMGAAPEDPGAAAMRVMGSGQQGGEE